MKVYPLSGTFMITAILGFLISAYYIYNLSVSWGFTFCLFFTLMFIASLISLTRASVPEEVKVKPEIYISGRKKVKRKK